MRLTTAEKGPSFAGATISFGNARVLQEDFFAVAASNCLITMLYNERPMRFRDACESIAPGSFYYRLTELQRCYGY